MGKVAFTCLPSPTHHRGHAELELVHPLPADPEVQQGPGHQQQPSLHGGRVGEQIERPQPVLLLQEVDVLGEEGDGGDGCQAIPSLSTRTLSASFLTPSSFTPRPYIQKYSCAQPTFPSLYTKLHPHTGLPFP